MCCQWTSFNADRSHYIVTSAIVAASVLLSLTTDCLGIVLELNVSVSIESGLRMTLRLIQGLLVASSLAYILPALCYLKLKPYSSPWSMDSICPHILLIIGISLTISGFVLPLRHALQDGYYCQHGIEPAYCTRMFPSSVNHTVLHSAIRTRP